MLKVLSDNRVRAVRVRDTVCRGDLGEYDALKHANKWIKTQGNAKGWEFQECTRESYDTVTVYYSPRVNEVSNGVNKT